MSRNLSSAQFSRIKNPREVMVRSVSPDDVVRNADRQKADREALLAEHDR